MEWRINLDTWLYVWQTTGVMAASEIPSLSHGWSGALIWTHGSMCGRQGGMEEEQHSPSTLDTSGL